MRKLLILLSIASVTIKAYSQDSDPLKKPEIWGKLSSQPTDSKLWSQYMGKDLFDLSSDEISNLQKWRAELISKNEQSLIKEQLAVQKMGLRDARTITESQYLLLLSDVNGNFVIIEDYFAFRFKSIGVPYKFYAESHTDNKYSKSLWVAEQEARLIELISKR
jgi:hypothetical protein